jgi:Na+/pantothenate symporter
MNATATFVFVLFFIGVTILGFVAAHWRKGDLAHLEEWGLGGRRFGTIVTWFLLGGDLYTAYTFIAVPALVFGAGATGFFALPYTILIYPFAFVVFPKLWSIAKRQGYVTSADFVSARYGSRMLALAIAVTGIVATMPYIALQLVGIEVVIGALGFDTKGFVGDLPLIIAFAILAAYTYTSGLRAPAMIAVVKDVLIYIVIFAAIIVIPPQLGGFGHIFSVVPPAKLLLKAPDVSSLNGYSAYATLAVGSALALFLYPHSITAVLSSKSGNTIRRNMAMLPAYSLVLGLLALLGFMALASGVKDMPEFAPYFKAFGPNFAVPALFLHFFPSWFVGVQVRGGDHVDRGREPVHAQHPQGVRQPQHDERAGDQCREAGLADRQGRRGRVHSWPAVDVRDPAAVAGRYLDHPDAAGHRAGSLHACARLPRPPDRLGGRHRNGHVDGDFAEAGGLDLHDPPVRHGDPRLCSGVVADRQPGGLGGGEPAGADVRHAACRGPYSSGRLSGRGRRLSQPFRPA